MSKFVVKKDLMKLGFSSWQSMMLIKQAKTKLANQGLTWYESKGLGRVPLETVEELLGVKIDESVFTLSIEEDELKDFCKKLPRAEFEDSERAKTVAIKAMRVVLLALGYDTEFVEDDFRKELEKVIVVKRNI